ncbi:MAG: uracil-DNA glycosylase [Candidatus Pacebacteria bacterium]|nr:uracil-DNA glycosylase [Candidatus Paceibacterota bacterium]
MQSQLPPSWNIFLNEEFSKPYFNELKSKVEEVYKEESVFPARENILNAFSLCPPDKIKVVILGQDPYHSEGQAHGLSFSVPEGTKIPPSLRNIYKEIKSDLGQMIPESGNLERWSKQGVLLLNATLTVESGLPGSHQGIGWEIFTDEVISKISSKKEYVVFILWGKFAESKSNLIDNNKHLILTTSHPSPFSAHKGFLGCKHFSKTNTYLTSHGLKEIEW